MCGVSTTQKQFKMANVIGTRIKQRVVTEFPTAEEISPAEIHYDPETKRQSVKWRQQTSLRKEKFRRQPSVGKIMTSVFSDKRGRACELLGERYHSQLRAYKKL
jgi:hypothetical protein